jgi:peptidoglycan/xylan/chitin deacetylase (PgdA/CDA1 family)
VTDVLVLSYHAVSEGWPAPLSVRTEELERQLRLLVSRGYRGCTFSAAVLGPRPERALAVTFDDGYRSVLDVAFPVLERLGLPGTVFVPTDFVSGDGPMVWPGIDHWVGGPHERELLPLSWPELRRLAECGWEIGSHTCSHPHLTSLGDAGLARELAESRGRIEQELGRPCRSLAYPYGDHDTRVLAATAAAGYQAACTVPRRLVEPSPLAWPRVGVYHGNGLLAFRVKVSPQGRRLRRTALWGALDSLRRALRKAPRAPLARGSSNEG